MEIITSCPVCNSESLEKIMSLHDYFLTGELFQITGCQECNLRFTNPKPSEGELPKYYDSPDYISHSSSTSGLMNYMYKLVREYTLYGKSKKIRHWIKYGSLLDIGCGTGEFLHRMRKNHFMVTGIEPNMNARNAAINNLNLDVWDEDQINLFDNESFDVITLWHVLEHVFNLNDRIAQIKRLLKPGGYLFIAVPNWEAWDAVHYGKYWAAFDVPRHLYHFNRTTLPGTLERFGFRLLKISPMKFDAFYISILSEKNKQGKINYLKGLINGMRSNLNALSKGNYSSNLFVFKKE